jgi:hypothetical protein
VLESFIQIFLAWQACTYFSQKKMAIIPKCYLHAGLQVPLDWYINLLRKREIGNFLFGR